MRMYLRGRSGKSARIAEKARAVTIESAEAAPTKQDAAE
jgi:hypothetical protein